jgi:hypothetical protein
MSKWDRYEILMQDPKISSFLPHTCKLTEQNLYSMLETHQNIILKPVKGSGGAGILNLSLTRSGQCEVQIGLKKETKDPSKLYSCVKEEILQEFGSLLEQQEAARILADTYIIQYRVPLATIGSRPFDIRVMVQRKIGLPWKVTGKLAKLASEGYAITNFSRSQATVIPAEQAIQQSNIKKEIHLPHCLLQLDQVGLFAAEQLQQTFENICIIGFDMGIDADGNVWIIEANFRPEDFLFLHLEDKTAYSAIQDYM